MTRLVAPSENAISDALSQFNKGIEQSLPLLYGNVHALVMNAEIVGAVFIRNISLKPCHGITIYMHQSLGYDLIGSQLPDLPQSSRGVSVQNDLIGPSRTDSFDRLRNLSAGQTLVNVAERGPVGVCCRVSSCLLYVCTPIGT